MLRDAGQHIAALPKAVHDRPEWQTAAEALLLAVERGGLSASKSDPELTPRRQPPKSYKLVR